MDTIEYDGALLIQKIPSLKIRVENGDLKVLKVVTGEGKLVERVVRFANMHVYMADEDMRIQIVDATLHDCHENVAYRPYGLMGLEIVGKPLIS